MNKHRAPTQVTIASTQSRTLLHDLVDRYWKFATVAALAITAAILVPHYLRQKSHASKHESWDRLVAEVQFDTGMMGDDIQVPTPAALASLADEWKGVPVGAWAKALETGSYIEKGDREDGERALEQLEQDWPDHPLVTERVFAGPDGNGQTLPEHMRSRIAALDAWEQDHPLLFSNPPIPEDAPKVRVNTSRGAFVLGLYSDRAPKHVENFLKLCREGGYNGTKFHRVVRDTLIQGGDPNSISGEPDTWGTGGFETTLEPEDDPQLRHFKGALSAWRKPGENRSSGHQFILMTGDSGDMDGKYTVFGRLLEGEDVVEEIDTGAVLGDRPQDPVVIESTEVLE